MEKINDNKISEVQGGNLLHTINYTMSQTIINGPYELYIHADYQYFLEFNGVTKILNHQCNMVWSQHIAQAINQLFGLNGFSLRYKCGPQIFSGELVPCGSTIDIYYPLLGGMLTDEEDELNDIENQMISIENNKHVVVFTACKFTPQRVMFEDEFVTRNSPHPYFTKTDLTNLYRSFANAGMRYNKLRYPKLDLSNPIFQDDATYELDEDIIEDIVCMYAEGQQSKAQTLISKMPMQQISQYRQYIKTTKFLDKVKQRKEDLLKIDIDRVKMSETLSGLKKAIEDSKYHADLAKSGTTSPKPETTIPKPINEDRKQQEMASKHKEQAKTNLKNQCNKIKGDSKTILDKDPHKEVKVPVNKVTYDDEPDGLNINDPKYEGDGTTILTPNNNDPSPPDDNNVIIPFCPDGPDAHPEITKIIEDKVQENPKCNGTIQLMNKLKPGMTYCWKARIRNESANNLFKQAVRWIGTKFYNFITNPIIVGSSIAGVFILSSLPTYAMNSRIGYAQEVGHNMLDNLMNLPSAVSNYRGPSLFNLITSAFTGCAAAFGMILPNKFPVTRYHTLTIAGIAVEPQKPNSEKREYDNHFDTTKNEVYVHFSERVTKQITILDIPLLGIYFRLNISQNTTQHAGSAELVANILAPININSMIRPVNIMERISRATNIGSFIDYDRADVFTEDVNNGAERLALGVIFSHKCHNLSTNVYESVFREPEEQVELLPYRATMQVITLQEHYLYLETSLCLAIQGLIYTAIGLAMKPLKIFRLLTRPHLLRLRSIMNMMVQLGHRWHIRAWLIYLLYCLVRMSRIRTH